MVPVTAALAVAALMLWPQSKPGDEPLWRGGDAEFTALSPVGALATAPDELRWSPHPSAAQYRVELFDATSRMIFTRIVSDTFVTLDDSSEPPTRGYWTVTPLTGSLADAGPSLVSHYQVTP
jgi:hypothetical protein